MQKMKILFTSHSKNINNEQENYSWDSDRMGVIVDKPIDKHNHTIDAFRMVCLKMRDEGIIKVV